MDVKSDAHAADTHGDLMAALIALCDYIRARASPEGVRVTATDGKRIGSLTSREDEDSHQGSRGGSNLIRPERGRGTRHGWTISLRNPTCVRDV